MPRSSSQLAIASGIALIVSSVPLAAQQPQRQWPPDSPDRPHPPVVTPGPAAAPVPPPSDAVVLFDGKNLSQWMAADSGPAKWIVKDGYVECDPGTGSMISRPKFGSFQLHIEFREPTPPKGEGQERGNSGVYLMSHYEIQVLDSYHNVTYADGQAGAVYGQTPPLVNPARPPGEWETYDIVFHRPIFNDDGSIKQDARVTVFFNDVLVQDNTDIWGWTVNGAVAHYKPHADAMPLVLQDHGNRIRYRDIWARPLPDDESR